MFHFRYNACYNKQVYHYQYHNDVNSFLKFQKVDNYKDSGQQQALTCEKVSFKFDL